MTWQSLTLGSQVFQFNEDEYSSYLDIGAREIKIPGGRSILQGIGQYAKKINFTTWLTGSTGKTEKATIEAEALKEGVIYFASESDGECWVLVNNVTPVQQSGSTQATYRYGLRIQLTIAGLGTEYKPCTLIRDYKIAPTKYTMSEIIALGLPVGVTSPSETVDLTRYASDQAASPANAAVQFVLSPDLAFTRYTQATQADRLKSVCRWKYGATHTRELAIDNGLVSLTPRIDEGGTRGRLDFSFWNGAVVSPAWDATGALAITVKSTGLTAEELTAGVPGVEILQDSWEKLVARYVFPTTATYGYDANLYATLYYGKPWIKLELEGAGMTLSQAEFDLYMTTGYRYYVRLGNAAQDATGGAYGTPETEATDTASVGVNYLMNAAALAADTKVAGFFMADKTYGDVLANDAGALFDRIGVNWDTQTIGKGGLFPTVWLYGYMYDRSGGSRSPEQLDDEIAAELQTQRTLVRVA